MKKFKTSALAPAPWLAGRPQSLWGALAILVIVVGALQRSQATADDINWGVYTVTWVCVLAFGLSWLRLWQLGNVASLTLDRVAASGVSLLAFTYGVSASATEQNLASPTLAAYVLACLAGMYALSGPSLDLPWQRENKLGGEAEGSFLVPALRQLWVLAVLLGLLLFSRWYTLKFLRTGQPTDVTYLYFMPRSAGYEGIQGGPPPRLGHYAAMLSYFAALAGGAYWLMRRAAQRPGLQIVFLLVMGFLGKLNIAWMSPTGLKQLADKIANIGTAYYMLIPKVKELGLWNFVTHFNELQARLSTHAETHPFGPELLYWGLSELLGMNPQRIAYAIMALACLTFIPIYQMARRLWGSPLVGLAAGLIYLCTPTQLLLSGAGIDCLVTMMLAWILYFLMLAVEDRSWRYSLLSGATLFVTMILTPGVALPLLFCGLWVAWLSLRESASLLEWLGRIGRAGLGLFGVALLLHGLLWLITGRQFNYLRVFDVGLAMQRTMPRVRPYELWVWLNMGLVVAFCGLPLFGVMITRVADAWRAGGRLDGLLIACALFFAVIVFMSLGPAEAQRMFQYCVLVFVFAGLPWVLGPRVDGASQPRPGRLAFLALLLFMNSVALEATVLDFW